MSDWAGDITIGLGWVYYDGPVGHTQFHQHYAVQVCFPFSGPLHVETSENSRSVEDVLVIGSNVSHRLSTPNATAKLLYIEPNLIGQNTEKLTVDEVEALDIPASRLKAIEQTLDHYPKLVQADFGLSLARLIWPEEAARTGFTVIDPRIQKSLADIDAAEDLNISLSQIVDSSGLSASRFRHLFSAQIGMPFKSYLLWIKLQRAFQSLATDSSLTRAAHIAGFSDSSHLSRTFKRTFGLTPADLNKNAHFTTRKRG
jgi:AraC family transcriptional regulator